MLRTVRLRTSSLAWQGLQRRAPRAYLRLAELRGADLHRVCRDTDLVIAGYPGSANSFARSAVLVLNPGLQVASHAHVWTEAADGVRHGIPTLLVVREPRGAVASRLSRFGGSSARAALVDYARFHEQVLARRLPEALVVADFREVVSRFGDVVARVNARYGTALVPFPHGDAQLSRGLTGLLAGANGAVPSGRRAAGAAPVRAALDDPALAGLLERCERAYRAISPAPEVLDLRDPVPPRLPARQGG